MPQQADEWREPEPSAYRPDFEESWLFALHPVADPEAASEAASGSSPVSSLDSTLESGLSRLALSEPSPGRIPWMEMTAMMGMTEMMETTDPSPIPPPRPGSHAQPGGANSIASLIHDTRNLITTIGLYCDLLDVPGVLSTPFRHYAGELRMVAGGSQRLLEKLAAIASSASPAPSAANVPNIQPGLIREEPANSLSLPLVGPLSSAMSSPISSSGPALVPPQPPGPKIALVGRRRDISQPDVSKPDRYSDSPANHSQSFLPPETGPELDAFSGNLRRGAHSRNFGLDRPVDGLAGELRANHRLLNALCGPEITIGLTIEGGNHPIPVAADDLTRILVNLVRNAADAMPTGGHIQIALEESLASLSLSITDTGPGIPEPALEAIFAVGYTTHISLDSAADSDADFEADSATGPDSASVFDFDTETLPGQTSPHRGLGLAIVRSIVTAAGGYIWAANRGVHSPEAYPAQSPQSVSRPGFQPGPQPNSESDSEPGNTPQTGAIFFLDFPIGSTADWS